MEELFTKVLSLTDITHRLTIPRANLEDFGMPMEHHAMNIQATDTLDQRWNFRLSVRRDHPNRRPVFTGQWRQFVNDKGLREGDRIILLRQHEGEAVQYSIRAERQIFGVWANVQ